MSSIVKWCGSSPSECDLCHRDLDTVFIDGKTRGGPWGMLCIECHRVYGVGLGTGKGQRFELVQSPRGPEWVKTDG